MLGNIHLITEIPLNYVVRINAEKSFTVHPNTLLVFEYIIIQMNQVFVSAHII